MSLIKNELQPKPRKVRGTGIYAGDEFTFRPAEEGTPSQLDVKTCKGGKTFMTTSAKNPQKVAHLSWDANSPDPWTEYTNKLRLLGIKPQGEQQQPAKERLVCEGGMEVFFNAKQRKLIYQGSIDLTQNRNWQSEVMRQLQIIVRTLPANKKFISVINQLKRGDKKL